MVRREFDNRTSLITSHHQILQGAGYVVLLSELNHKARVIPLDGRPHLPEAIRQWNGDSRGRWEGNTHGSGLP